MKILNLNIILVALMGIFFLSSCTEEKATTGSLTITALDSTGIFMPGVQINIARTLTDLQNKNYIKSEYTNNIGSVMFHELPPDNYWVSATGWDDYLSARLYVGIDHYVTLWLNNPQGKK